MDKKTVRSLILPALLLAVLFLTLAPSARGEAAAADNPFFTVYGTPFDTPPFERIQNAHFLSAVEEGIRRHQAEIDAIVADSRPATFANTIVALDSSGKFLERVAGVFYSHLEAVTSKELQELAAKIAPLVSAHQDNILLNDKLFARVKAVYDRRARLKLSAPQRFLLEKGYRQFVRNGALLDDKQQARLRDINRDLALLTLKFEDNLLAETNSSTIVIDSEGDLAGLPEGVVTAAAETAKAMNMEGKWVFTAQKPSWIPFLQYAEKRSLREALYACWFMRGDRDNEHDNKAVLQKIVDLRAE
ncbi:MAG: peptidase M3, partial [Candidatus Aminicenantes bacterium]|nr:peptidase M3 [Candidatus Aminicenantes bacterium]